MTSIVYGFSGAKEFPFPYPVRVPSQITVEVRPGGVVPPTEYDVIGYGPGATGVTIRWPGAPGASSTAQLIISRYVEPERVTEFSDDEGVTAGALNAEFDNVYSAVEDFASSLADRVDVILDVELPAQLDVRIPPLVEAEVLPYVKRAEQAQDAAEGSASLAAAKAGEASTSERVASSAAAKAGQDAVRSEAAAQRSESAEASAVDLVQQATSGFTGFQPGVGYDFGSITAPATYFNRDFGRITDPAQE